MNSFSTWLTVSMLADLHRHGRHRAAIPRRRAHHAAGHRHSRHRALPAATRARRQDRRGRRLRLPLPARRPKAGKPVDAGNRDAARRRKSSVRDTVRARDHLVGLFPRFHRCRPAFGFYVSVPVLLVTFLRREAEASWRMALGLGLRRHAGHVSDVRGAATYSPASGVLDPMITRALGILGPSGAAHRPQIEPARTNKAKMGGNMSNVLSRRTYLTGAATDCPAGSDAGGVGAVRRGLLQRQDRQLHRRDRSRRRL